MKLEVNQRRTLRAFPIQLIETEGDVVVRRGCTQVRLSGEGAYAIVRDVFERASREGGVDETELVESFAGPLRASVRSLLSELCTRRLIVDDQDPSPPELREGPTEVFFWHFASSPAKLAASASDSKITVIGVNNVSRQLAQTLALSGTLAFEVIDHPLLRNLRFFDKAGALLPKAWGEDAERPLAFEAWSDMHAAPKCLVATADFGGSQSMRRWNELAIATNSHFLPVMLEDLIGYVGPLVIPGETACFECLRARQNACFEDPAAERFADNLDFEAQAVVSYHPAMASVLGDIAAMELAKFYGGIPGARASVLIEVNLLTTHLTTRKVLKIPRCKVCSPLIKHGSASPEQMPYLPQTPVDR